MPTIVPIADAGTGPLTRVTYAAYGSADIGAISQSQSYNSADIINLSTSESYGSLTVEGRTEFGSYSAIQIGTLSRISVPRAIDVLSGEGFLILVDVLAEELTGANLGSFAHTEINAKLTVDGNEVAIKSFGYQVPTGRLGSLLNVELAEPDATLIPAGADIRFELIVTIDGTEHSYLLMDGAKMQERSNTIAFSNQKPEDEVTFGALDVMTDKFSLAPRKPVIMFDPARVKYDDVSLDPKSAVRTEAGALIMPSLEPVYGLSMKQILKRAYTGVGGSGFIAGLGPGFLSSIGWASLINWGGATEQAGCGFTEVITNIPDYKVRRADFTIEGGWHDGAQPVVAFC
jgi:hypothetical protein